MSLLSIKRQLIAYFLVASLAQAAQATPTDAANFVNDLSQRVITAVKRTDITDNEKEAKLNELFLQAVDTKWIGKFSLGRYWRTITPTQQEQFLNLYSKYLTGLYVPNFRKYTGNIVKVTDSKEIRPSEYLVQTELTDASNTMNIKISYRLLQNQKELEKFIIFDVIAEGVSLIATQRAELNSVIEKDTFTGLIQLLSQKITTANR